MGSRATSPVTHEMRVVALRLLAEGALSIRDLAHEAARPSDGTALSARDARRALQSCISLGLARGLPVRRFRNSPWHREKHRMRVYFLTEEGKALLWFVTSRRHD